VPGATLHRAWFVDVHLRELSYIQPDLTFTFVGGYLVLYLPIHVDANRLTNNSEKFVVGGLCWILAVLVDATGIGLNWSEPFLQELPAPIAPCHLLHGILPTSTVVSP